MPQQDTKELKDKIIFIIQRRGPSLPIHVAQATGLSMLFSSAFLSELISDKRIKISNMRVGSSPLYMIPGQEPMLERFSQHLKSKEREAYELLKSKKVLRDKEQDPPIRVALRAIKDFAFPVLHLEEIFWIYFTLKEEEAESILNNIHIEPIKKQSPLPQTLTINQQEVKQIEPIVNEIQKNDIIKEETKKIPIKEYIDLHPKKVIEEKFELEEIKEKKDKKPKEKIVPEFPLKVISFLNKMGIPVIEQIELKKKEFLGKALINSELGKIEFLVIAKDKKKISENDLTISAQKSHHEKMPILFVTQGEIDKKAEKHLESYKNIIKILKIE